MTKGFGLSLGGIWLLAGLASLMLPIVIPTFANPQSFAQNVIGTATAAMYVLSFPLGLFATPLLYVSQIVIGVDPNSIGGKYLNIFFIFLLGLVQWFWIVPSIFRKRGGVGLDELVDIPVKQLAGPSIPVFFDSESRTPLERVLRDEDGD